MPALERLRRLSESSLVLIDAASEPASEAVLRELQQLPHLLVADADGPEGSLAAACDLVLDSKEPLDGCAERLADLEAQARRPAVIILAQLLRCATVPDETRLHLESLSYATLQGGDEFEAWLASRQS